MPLDGDIREKIVLALQCEDEGTRKRLNVVTEAMSRVFEGLDARNFSIGKLVVAIALAAESVRLMTDEQIDELAQSPGKPE
jgi:hypothetical protein